ncbi:carbamoyl phosphate synthase preATP-grasp domain-containing protein [Amycolatopsis speibonae]|uniref:ATP-grasp domain-containing protein n=1 Tax=Amycolatopsis speibonae TaxID=1450224 RepID=A0ABV7P720_9PSEU
MIGSGPILLGHAAPACRALKAEGLRLTVVDGNSSTATTDPTFADSTYLEPVDPGTIENVIARERPDALLPTLGGKAALDTAVALYESGVLARYGVELLGTGMDAILLGENRVELARIVRRAGAEVTRTAAVPGWKKYELEVVRDRDDKVAVVSAVTPNRRMRDVAVEVARAVGTGPGGCTVGFAVDPCGGRMVVTGFDPRVVRSSTLAAKVAIGRTLDELGSELSLDHAAELLPPDPAGRFPGDAIEVDALYDGYELYLGGVMEWFEAACALPPITLGRADLTRIRESTRVLAESIGLRGPLNVRYALASGVLCVLDANPQVGRTVPFVSKATGVPLTQAAARVTLGARIADLRAEGLLPAVGDGGVFPPGAAVAVKQGEVMGIDSTFGIAYAKSWAAASGPLPTKGRAFVSFAGRDNRAMIFPVKALADSGFEILVTEGNGKVLRYFGVPVTIVSEPSIVDIVMTGEIVLVVDTLAVEQGIRAAAAACGIPWFGTVRGFAAAVQGIEAVDRGEASVVSLQEHIAELWS